MNMLLYDHFFIHLFYKGFKDRLRDRFYRDSDIFSEPLRLSHSIFLFLSISCNYDLSFIVLIPTFFTETSKSFKLAGRNSKKKINK